jgi:hypothetical protein
VWTRQGLDLTQLWCVIGSAQFGVNDLAHYFGDHLCLCGIVSTGI